MATCITSPSEKPLLQAMVPEYQPHVQRLSTKSKIELAIFALFAALVSAALIMASDTVLQAAAVMQPAAYDMSRAALLWTAFMVAQSSWHGRCTLPNP